MPSHLHHGANAPGLAAPKQHKYQALKDETPGVTAEGFRGQTRDDCTDSALMGMGDQCQAQQASQLDKALFTLRAEAALHNIVVHRVIDGCDAIYMVGGWSWTRSCDSLDEARALVNLLGGGAR